MIVDKIEQMCENRDMSVPALERKANIACGLIRHWRKSSPSIRTLKKVAKALGIDVSELLDNEQEVEK